MTATSYQIADHLYLVLQSVGKTSQAKPVETNVNHVAVIDCSGSMAGDLPALREHLKAKLPKLMKEGDTLSVVWFSGRNEFGTLLEAEPVATLADLTEVNRQIDRWLRPVGLTGFKEPIEEVERLVSKVSKKNSNPFSLFFMSDGCDNQWQRNEILKVVERSAAGLAAATVVEYGYYADRPLLTQMAEKWGGSLIFSENFGKFSPVLDAAVQRTVAGKKMAVSIPGDAIGGFAFALGDKEIVTYAVEGGKVQVPEGTKEVAYLSPVLVDAPGDAASTVPGGYLYAALSLFAVRMKPDVVLAILKKTGDVRFIESFAKCFGKQAYSAFQEETQKAAFDPVLRLREGYDPNRIPREDAFTVIEFLNLLQSDPDNRVLLGNPAFKYNRIGRARLDASTRLTTEEQEELKQLSEKLANTKKRAEVKAIKTRIDELTSRPEPLKFQESGDGAYPVRNLSFNEDRCNVSIQIKKQGTVNLSDRASEAGHASKVPGLFGTFCYRNYAVIKDGIVNVSRLPVNLSQASYAQLVKAISDGRFPTMALVDVSHDGHVIDLSKLPVINRQMVKATSARDLFEKTWELTKARAGQKVFNSIKKERQLARTSEGFESLYGPEATAWLKEQGITEHGGFAPKSVQADAVDFYLAKQLEVKIKGYSTIPSLNEFRKQLAKGKLTGPATLMQPFVQAADYQLTANEKGFDAWLENAAEEQTERARGLIYDVARIKFAVIVGQTWFTEFKSLDEHEMDLTLDGERLHFSAELREVEEKI